MNRSTFGVCVLFFSMTSPMIIHHPHHSPLHNDRNLLLPMHNISPMLSWRATTSKNPWRASVLFIFFCGWNIERSIKSEKIENGKSPSLANNISVICYILYYKEVICYILYYKEVFCCIYRILFICFVAKDSNLKKPGELFGSAWNLFHHILRFDRDFLIKKSFAQKSRWPFIWCCWWMSNRQ